MRRILSLSLPRFPTDLLNRERSRRGATPLTEPFATVTGTQGRLVLAAVSESAEADTLFPGQGLSDARALSPALITFPADPAGASRRLDALAEWCTRYTPWTAAETSGLLAGGDYGIWLDVSGCAHLFGGEEALIDDLIERMRKAGLGARAAIADTPGAAWALSRFGADSRAVVPHGEQRAALADLPVAALRLPPIAIDVLDRLGLRRIGDLYPLPRAALAARFGQAEPGSEGEAVRLRLDQALGLVDEPISRLNARLGQPLPSWRVRLNLPEPIARLEDIVAGLDRLLAVLCHRLETGGCGARQLALDLFRTDATVCRVAIGTGQPSRDGGHLARLFAEHLDGIDAGFGIEQIVLTATVAEPLAVDQLALDSRDAAADRLAPLLDRLGNRLGPANVIRLQPRESHLPERAVMPRPALTRLRQAPQAWPASPRPLHLLLRPEPVDIGTSSSGAPKRMQWRRRTHHFTGTDGPERIAPEWWREDAQEARDYYRVEDRHGGRFWVYRAEAGWFLHGLFA